MMCYDNKRTKLVEKGQYFFVRGRRLPLLSSFSLLDRFSSNYSSFYKRKRFSCFVLSISMIRSRILLVPFAPVRLREGKMDMPVPRWKVLPFIEASSDRAARLLPYPLGLSLCVFPVLAID
jgi:hypothetical protein